MIADEIQSGLARTGHTFACDHWGVVPDVYLLGKALGGGVVALSAVVADYEILGVLHPGEHGSTFGGNPLAAAIGTTVVSMLGRGEFQARSAESGAYLHARLRGLVGHGVLAVRGLGLWAGVDIDPALGTGKQMSLRLADRGVLVKDTHGSTLRFAPPPVISEKEIDWAVEQFAMALGRLAHNQLIEKEGQSPANVDQPERADAAAPPGCRHGRRVRGRGPLGAEHRHFPAEHVRGWLTPGRASSSSCLRPCRKPAPE